MTRKKAEDINCTSADECAFRGKGQRKKKKKILTSDSEDSEDSQLTRYICNL